MTPTSARPAKIAFWAWAISTILYGAACVLPARDFGPDYPDSLDFGPRGPTPGLVLLLIGWVQGNPAIAWSANVVLLGAVGCLPVRRYGTAATFAAVAVLLGLWSWIDRHIDGTPMFGSYLWLGSMIVLTGGAVLACRAASEEPPESVVSAGAKPV
jgi:hypothetical protein